MSSSTSKKDFVENEKRKLLLPCLDKIEYLKVQLSKRLSHSADHDEIFQSEVSIFELPSIQVSTTRNRKRKLSAVSNVSTKEKGYSNSRDPNHNHRFAASYARLLENLSPPTYISKIKSVDWISSIIENIYDYCSSEMCIHEISNTFLSQRNTDGGTLIDSVSANSQVQGSVTYIFPKMCRRYLRQKFGIKPLLRNALYTLLSSIEFHHEQSYQVKLFSSFLREILDIKYLIFFLFLRDLLIKSGNAGQCSPKAPHNMEYKAFHDNTASFLQDVSRARCSNILRHIGLDEVNIEFLLSCNSPMQNVVRDINKQGHTDANALQHDIINIIQCTPQSILDSLSKSDETFSILSQIESSLEYENEKKVAHHHLRKQLLHTSDVRAEVESMRSNQNQNAQLFIRSHDYKICLGEIEKTEKKIEKLNFLETNIWNEILKNKIEHSDFTPFSQLKCIIKQLLQRLCLSVNHYCALAKKKGDIARTKKIVHTLNGRDYAAFRIQKCFRGFQKSKEAKHKVETFVTEKRRKKNLRDQARNRRENRALLASEQHQRRMNKKKEQEIKLQQDREVKNKQLLSKYRSRESAIIAKKHHIRMLHQKFNSWKSFVFYSQLSTRRNRSLLAFFFRIWTLSSDQLKKTRFLKETKAVFIQSLFRQFCAKKKFKTSLFTHKKKTSKVHALAEKVTNRIMRKMFENWFQMATFKRRMKRIILALVKGKIFNAFHYWVQIVNDRKQDMEYKAQFIQKVFRGVLARRRVSYSIHLMNSSIRIQSMMRRRLALKHTNQLKRDRQQVEIAVMRLCGQRTKRYLKIVFFSFFRNAKIQKDVRRMIAKTFALRQQLYFQTWKREHLKMIKTKNNCAKCIQKAWRLRTSKLIKLYQQNRHKSAGIIQRNVRGFLDRIYVEQKYLETQSAIRIQKLWRGVWARKDYFQRLVNFIFERFDNNNISILEKVLRVDSDIRDNLGNTIIHLACKSGYKNIVQMGLRYGADINAKNMKGRTPLHTLVGSSFPNQTKLGLYLLSKGAKSNCKDYNGITPLILSSILGHVNCMEFLVPFCNIGDTDINGRNALFHSFLASQDFAVDFLMKNGADLSTCVDRNLSTPLHATASCGDLVLMEKIMELCSSSEEYAPCDHLGRTPLHCAVLNNMLGSVTCLLEWGAVPSPYDDNNETPLHYCVKENRVALARILSACESDVNAKTKDTGDTALHIAVEKGSFDMCKILLSNCSEQNVQNSVGNTCAHVAAKEGHINIMRLLIDYDVDFNRRNFNGLTPLGLARLHQRSAIISLIDKNYVEREGLKKKDKRMQEVVTEIQTFSKGETHLLELKDLKTSSQLSCVNNSIENKVFNVETYFENMTCEQRAHVIKNSIILYEAGVLSKNFLPWALLEIEIKDANTNKKVIAWVNRTTNMLQRHAPPEIASLPGAPSIWTQLSNVTGKLIYYNEVTGEKLDSTYPPLVMGGKVLRKRVNCQSTFLVENDVRSSEYFTYWENEMGEIKANQRRIHAANVIQSVYRKYKSIVLAKKRRVILNATLCIQSNIRTLRAKRRTEQLKKEIQAARRLQAFFRGYLQRINFIKLKDGLIRERNILSATRTIERFFRGFKGRQKFRRTYAETIYPAPSKDEDWICIVENSSKIRRWGVWDEYLYLWPDVFVYSNRVTKCFTWEKPCALEKYDMDEFSKLWEVVKQGFTMKEENAAVALQNAYRIKRATEMRKVILKGIHIMKRSEFEYLQHPFTFEDIDNHKNIVHLCNYMLYLHTIERDYDRARPLYSKAMEYMVRRGPDNAFVLLSYAMFMASTCEEDFDNILDMVRRARTADPELTSFAFAEAGYFRQATFESPNDARALCNYAICLQFYGTVTSMRKCASPDLELSKKYYIEALKRDPYDESIVENFNFMLHYLKGSTYDAFECFVEHQSVQAKECLSEWQSEVILNEEFEKKNTAAVLLQKTFRGFFIRKHPLHEVISSSVSAWTSEEDDALTEARAYLNNNYLDIAKQLPGRSALEVRSRLNEMSRKNSLHHREIEENFETCEDVDGNKFYYNTETGISTWTLPYTLDSQDNCTFGNIDDWEQHYDDNGNVYWYNTSTAESQWQHPSRDRDKVFYNEREGEKEIAKDTPNTWELCNDSEGNTFYYNIRTQESVWNIPLEDKTEIGQSGCENNFSLIRSMKLRIGSYVFARYQRGEHWYPARIVDVTEGLYSVLYDDGDFEEAVSDKLLCLRKAQLFVPDELVHVNYMDLPFKDISRLDRGVIVREDLSNKNEQINIDESYYNVILENGNSFVLPPEQLFPAIHQ